MFFVLAPTLHYPCGVLPFFMPEHERRRSAQIPDKHRQDKLHETRRLWWCQPAKIGDRSPLGRLLIIGPVIVFALA